mmetsp:Transcript_22934/g.58573  ORF Transcript_22934/g.58573 Transcript_22934/m.58573 type:complete len:158 (+) Transcript_22934:64-537(+)
MLWARLTNLRPAQVHTPCLQQIRWISEEQLNASQDHLDELFHRTLQNASRKKSDRPILTTRREALALYREVLRYSNLFVWKDNQGRVWRDVIRTSTRKEFEDARFERDPEIVNRLIITGRDAVSRSVEAFLAKRAQIIDEESAAHDARQQQPPPGRR